jgi:integrase
VGGQGLDTYARWIPGADAGSERLRLAAAMVATSPALPQSQNETAPELKKPRKFNNLRGFQIGRRDWTRTNDPHHVKVVL